MTNQVPNTLHQDGFQSPDTVLNDELAHERSSMVTLVNHGFAKGTILYFRQRRFIMPEKGQAFRVPRVYAQPLIASHTPGKLTMQGQGFPAQVKAGTDIPEGYMLVPVPGAEDAPVKEEKPNKK